MIFYELAVLQLEIGDDVLHIPSGQVSTITNIDHRELYFYHTAIDEYDAFGFFYNVFSEFSSQSSPDIKQAMCYPNIMRIIPYDNKRIKST